ncbi:unnamed protein product [Brugia pahangi]|uniref:Acyl_transf_3 domain-containing protein n=1 Tax=Brugia pahangi TaxID=6280 RepID=A0A0N4T5A6_BRUPA|nr:unnamed protein product [Brugia pahangi]
MISQQDDELLLNPVVFRILLFGSFFFVTPHFLVTFFWYVIFDQMAQGTKVLTVDRYCYFLSVQFFKGKVFYVFAFLSCSLALFYRRVGGKKRQMDPQLIVDQLVSSLLVGACISTLQLPFNRISCILCMGAVPTEG